MISREIPNTGVIRAEASSWLAQLETGNLDHADVAILREWVRRSPKHINELRRLARLSGELNVLTEMSGAMNEAAEFHHPIVRKHSSSPLPWIAFAGCMALVVLSFAWFFAPDVVEPQALATNVGEYEEYLLEDGSMIALNTNSRLIVDYSDQVRSVVMQSGEALFTVAKDPERPFVVQAGTQRVEAVGTAFLIRLDDAQVEVSVTEGRVRLSNESEVGPTPDTAQPEPIQLEMGQSMKVHLSSQEQETAVKIQPVSDVELRRKLAWREGLLDFHQTALNEVVVEIGRHTGLEIVIADAALGAREFDGLFRVGETESLFEVLKLNYGVQVSYLDTKRVLLTSKDSE